MKKPVIKLNKKVVNKIYMLNTEFHNVEWCGIVIYKITNEKSINPFNNITIDVIDIYPTSKGTSVTVNRDDTVLPKVYKIFGMECLIGTIHSHNNMDSFFSETDVNDIKTNVGLYSQYLSIVVNNKMDIKAKIAFNTIKRIKIKEFIKDLNGKIHKQYKDELKKDAHIIDLEVKMETTPVEDWFINAINEIKTKSNKKEKAYKYNYKDFYDRTQKEKDKVNPANDSTFSEYFKTIDPYFDNNSYDYPYHNYDFDNDL